VNTVMTMAFNDTTGTSDEVPNTGDMILRVENLSVSFSGGAIRVVDNLNLQVRRGRTLAIVGESGSGKSVTSLALLKLLPQSARVGGRAVFRGRGGTEADLLGLPDAESRRLRGNEISMIFQEPMSALNPVMQIGQQLFEVLHNHGQVPSEGVRARAIEMLTTVGIPDAEARLTSYPHELSGGMRQRVMIAMALMMHPVLLIADEPTTALDVTIQAQILLLLRRLQRKLGMGMIFITHDLAVVGQIADDVAVMYSGRVVEAGPVRDVFAAPRHPYTQGLLRSAPSVDAAGNLLPLEPIPGTVPLPSNPPPGCRFHPRCSHAVAGICDETEPQLEQIGPQRSVRCLRWKEVSE